MRWGQLVWVDVVGFGNDMADNEEFTLLVSWFCWFHLVSIQKRKFHRRTLYACPLVVFTPPLALHAVLIQPVMLAFCGGPWHLR